jgi:hypothetical protein
MPPQSMQWRRECLVSYNFGMEQSDRPRFTKVGALWKPKPGAKSLGSGTITVDGMQQRFIIVRNDRKKPDSKEPDYTLLASEPATPDEYVQRRQQVAARPAEPDDPIPTRPLSRPQPTPAPIDDEEIPF